MTPFGTHRTADLPPTDNLTGLVYEPHFYFHPASLTTTPTLKHLPLWLPSPKPLFYFNTNPYARGGKSTASDSPDGCDTPRVRTQTCAHIRTLQRARTHCPNLLLLLLSSLSCSPFLTPSDSASSLIFISEGEKKWNTLMKLSLTFSPLHIDNSCSLSYSWIACCFDILLLIYFSPILINWCLGVYTWEW